MEREAETTINRRRFLQALAAVGVATACGPSAPPTAASPAPSATSVVAKPVSIEWWRRNYTPGTANAETVTSDGAVKGFRVRNPNFTISIQGGPFGADHYSCAADRPPRGPPRRSRNPRRSGLVST